MNEALSTPLFYHQDALSSIAAKIIDEQHHRLPDLSHIVVILPDFQPAHRLKRLISREAERYDHLAILPPQCTTLREYIERSISLDTGTIPSEQRVLVLMESLQAHRALFQDANLWTASDALFTLFDQLILHQSELPNDLNDFIHLLEQSYTCSAAEIPHLSHEAQLVHTLWQAWHQQLHAYNLLDANAAYLIKLNKHIQTSDKGEEFFYIAHDQSMLPAERQWLEHHINKHLAHVFYYPEQRDPLFSDTQISELNNSASAQLIERIFGAHEEDFRKRALDCREHLPQSPIAKKIQVFNADNFENEARAISLQIRQWRLQNIKRVGLIIEDRQLARRVRALLERANIALRDAGGWALSTTSAAALLESWLEAIEENFAHRPLFSVIKSAFFLRDDETLQAVYHLEHDIIRRENIASDLGRYRRALNSRLNRIQQDSTETYDLVLTLIDKLEHAAEPLRAKLTRSDILLSSAMNALRESLCRVGLYSHFQEDEAGKEILQMLEQLTQVSSSSPLGLTWEDFRTWLSRNLERRNFKPVDDHLEYVDLLHLPQTALAHYEGLIIGGLTQEHFPGSNEVTPFFNQQVKTQLGLPDWKTVKQRHLNDFSRLLQSAPQVFLSVNTGDDSQTASPWLELLEAFHSLAYQGSLQHPEMAQYLQHAKSDIIAPGNDQLCSSDLHPPSLEKGLMPEALSASAHQKLIDCPYAYFSAYVLRLQAPDEIRDVMAKNEYGSRVHRCLEAFHTNIESLPGPFSEALTTDSRQAAIQLLNDISEKVFAFDLEQNFQHLGWLRRWQSTIPLYVDWQTARAKEWQMLHAEQAHEKNLPDAFSVNGRIDRIEHALGERNRLAIIDYKTGNAASIDETRSGESVQLPHYALAVDGKIDEALFVKLEQSRIHAITLSGESLQDVLRQNQERLTNLHSMLETGAPLPAWGDENTCQWCNFAGICRTPSMD